MTMSNENGKRVIDLLYGVTKTPTRLTFEGKKKYRAVSWDSALESPRPHYWADTPEEALAQLAESMEACIGRRPPFEAWIEEGYPIGVEDLTASAED